MKILITGATGTIGRATAERLSSPGSSIALQYFSHDALAEEIKGVCKARGADAAAIRCDLSRQGAAEDLVRRATEAMGGLDLLVHCAAIFRRMPLGRVTAEEWDHIVGLDLRAAFFLAQEAGILMQKDGGRMIFISDVAAAKPYAGYLPYCIAKAGIDCLVKGLAKSLAPKVLVNAIAPYVVTRPEGITDRGWNDLLSKMPARKAQSPEEIAGLIAAVAASESMTGQIIAVDGGRLLR